MTNTVSIGEIQNSVQNLLALTKTGDEIVIEENGNPVARVIPYRQDLEQEFSAWEAAGDEDFLNLERKMSETK